MVNSGERVTDVHCTEDKLTVDLADGRSISVPLALGIPFSCTRPLGSVTIGPLLALALESTGQNLMRTSVWRDCFAEHYLPVPRR
jgi:hypothetical protein